MFIECSTLFIRWHEFIFSSISRWGSCNIVITYTWNINRNHKLQIPKTLYHDSNPSWYQLTNFTNILPPFITDAFIPLVNKIPYLIREEYIHKLSVKTTQIPVTKPAISSTTLPKITLLVLIMVVTLPAFKILILIIVLWRQGWLAKLRGKFSQKNFFSIILIFKKLKEVNRSFNYKPCWKANKSHHYKAEATSSLNEVSNIAQTTSKQLSANAMTSMAIGHWHMMCIFMMMVQIGKSLHSRTSKTAKYFHSSGMNWLSSRSVE